jgi:alpha-1,2-mannosyltransferase
MFDAPADRARGNALLWLAVAIGAVLYCRHYWDEAPGLSLYVVAAQCMLDGLPLQSCDATFTYPPLFALAIIPLVPLPMVLRNLVWYLVTLGSLYGCITLSVGLARRIVPAEWSKRDLAWLYGAGILLSLKFIFAAVGNQSYDAVVVLLVIAGLSGAAADRPGPAGASFGAAAALKATPLLFLPYLLLKRHYRAAVVMAVVTVMACLLPDVLFTLGRKSFDNSYFIAWLRQVAEPALTEKLSGNPHTFWMATNPNNNSLRGMLGIFTTDDAANFKVVLYTVYAVYGAIVGLFILWTRNQRSAIAVDGALLLISMLMLSPMTSQSHYVALILPIFAAVAVWLKGDAAMRAVAGCVLVANVVLTNATSKDLTGQAITFWAKEHRLLVADALLLVVFFAILVVRSRPSTVPFEAAAAVEQSSAG